MAFRSEMEEASALEDGIFLKACEEAEKKLAQENSILLRGRIEKVMAAFRDRADPHAFFQMYKALEQVLTSDEDPDLEDPSCEIYTFGKEAEELRNGIEDILEWNQKRSETREALQDLLDRVDARDSLHYLERGKKEVG